MSTALIVFSSFLVLAVLALHEWRLHRHSQAIIALAKGIDAANGSAKHQCNVNAEVISLLEKWRAER